MRFLGADGLVGDKKADAPGRGILSVHNVRGAGDWCCHERFFSTTLIGIINDHLDRLHLNKRSTDSRQWSSPLPTASSQGLHRWKPWLAFRISNLHHLQLSTLLTNPPSRAAVTTTCGVLDPPLGKTRLALARFSLQNIPLSVKLLLQVDLRPPGNKPPPSEQSRCRGEHRHNSS